VSKCAPHVVVEHKSDVRHKAGETIIETPQARVARGE
jgi:hypothetical protein